MLRRLNQSDFHVPFCNRSTMINSQTILPTSINNRPMHPNHNKPQFTLPIPPPSSHRPIPPPNPLSPKLINRPPLRRRIRTLPIPPQILIPIVSRADIVEIAAVCADPLEGGDVGVVDADVPVVVFVFGAGEAGGEHG